MKVNIHSGVPGIKTIWPENLIGAHYWVISVMSIILLGRILCGKRKKY